MAAHDEIEFEEPTYSVCDCCGETTTHLVRFVSRSGNAFAIYYADFSPGHDFVSVLASFGDWEESAPPLARVAFALRIWTTHDSYQVGLVDAEHTVYKSGFMGSILNRDESLMHPLKIEAFALSDHIVECDQPVIQFLNSLCIRSDQRI